jgi:hypothetical protein
VDHRERKGEGVLTLRYAAFHQSALCMAPRRPPLSRVGSSAPGSRLMRLDRRAGVAQRMGSSAAGLTATAAASFRFPGALVFGRSPKGHPLCPVSTGLGFRFSLLTTCRGTPW